MQPFMFFFFFQAEDGIRDSVASRGLGDVYKRQQSISAMFRHRIFQSLIGPLTFDAALYFILFFLILDLIGL